MNYLKVSLGFERKHPCKAAPCLVTLQIRVAALQTETLAKTFAMVLAQKKRGVTSFLERFLYQTASLPVIPYALKKTLCPVIVLPCPACGGSATGSGAGGIRRMGKLQKTTYSLECEDSELHGVENDRASCYTSV